MTKPELDDRDPPPLPAVNPFAECVAEAGEPRMPLSLATLQLPWAAALVILVLYGIVNIAAVPFGENMSGPPEGLELILFAVGLGLIGGQIGGLSAVLVWGRGPFWARLVLLWLVGAILYGCWIAGLLAWLNRDHWGYQKYLLEFARAVAASLPLISLAVQLPQWLARFYFGWRIESPGGSASAASQGLSIRDLLVGTVVTALTITAVRFSLAADQMTTAVWMAWGIAVGILAVISALVMLPLLVLVFRSPPHWALLYILVGSPLLAGATVYVIVLVDGGPGGPDTRAVILFLIAGTSCVAATSAPLWLARWAGYRLKLGREA